MAPPPTPRSLHEKSTAIAEKRARRRAGKRTAECVEIDQSIISCPSTEIGARFRSFLEQNDTIFRPKSSVSSKPKGTSPLECYQIVINSLHALHAKQYPGHSQSDRQAMVNAFIRRLVPCFSLSSDVSSPTENRLVEEAELFILLEMHLLRFYPACLTQTQIVNRLRNLYLASDPVTFRHFLDDTICDEFSEDLPFYIAGIYEQLALDMPLDLHRFQSQEYRQQQELAPNQLEFKNRLSGKMDQFWQSLLLEDEEEAEQIDDDDDSQIGEAVEKENRRMGSEKGPSTSKLEADELRTRAPKKLKGCKARCSPLLRKGGGDQQVLARRRLIVVPETPEKASGGGQQQAAADEEVIEQTPIGKIRGDTLPKSSKFALLLRKEEERLAQLQLQQREEARSGNCTTTPSTATTATAIRQKRALALVRKAAGAAAKKKASPSRKSAVVEPPSMSKMGRKRRHPPTPPSTTTSSRTTRAPNPNINSSTFSGFGPKRRMMFHHHSTSTTASSSIASFPFSRKS